MRFWRLGLCLAAAATALAAPAAPPSLQTGTVLDAAERLRPGEYLWVPEIAPDGPMLLIVSLATQRAVLYRNGLPIAISTVSSGSEGHETPTGVFSVLQRRVEHYSNLYNNAPMPYMQRLTWDGIALHAGNLPGYPASHGCIRLPLAFARLLYGTTHLGMTVVVTDRLAVPRLTPSAQLLEGAAQIEAAVVDAGWHPERSPSGPVSIVISAADGRVVVIRNGAPIGSAPVEIEGSIDRTSAYVLQRIGPEGPVWLAIPLPGQAAADAAPVLRGRIRVADDFRAQVDSVLAPGTTVVVTADSLRAGSSGDPVMVLEEDREGPANPS